MAEADLLDEALARVGLLQEVRQPPRVPVDLEPARGVHFLSLFVSFRGRLSRRRCHAPRRRLWELEWARGTWNRGAR